MIIDALRKANETPLSTRDVADYIINTSNLDGPEARLIYRSAATNLNFFARRGKVAKFSKGMSTTWQLQHNPP